MAHVDHVSDLTTWNVNWEKVMLTIQHVDSLSQSRDSTYQMVNSGWTHMSLYPNFEYDSTIDKYDV